VPTNTLPGGRWPQWFGAPASCRQANLPPGWRHSDVALLGGVPNRSLAGDGHATRRCWWARWFWACWPVHLLPARIASMDGPCPTFGGL